MVRHTARRLVSFSRDRLYLSIYESCKHRPTAIDDATALTLTVITALRPKIDGGVVERDTVIATTAATLSNFDRTAAAVYTAYHPAG